MNSKQTLSEDIKPFTIKIPGKLREDFRREAEDKYMSRTKLIMLFMKRFIENPQRVISFLFEG